MALKFSRKERTYIPKWGQNDELPEDDQISLSFKPLTVEDMFAVQRATKVNLFGGLVIDEKDPDSFDKYWQLLREVIVTYTSNYKNIIVDDSEVSDPGSVIDALGADHMDLINEIFNHVVTVSTGTNEEAKNLEAESGPTAQDSALSVENASPTTYKKSETVEENIPTQDQVTL